MRDGTRRFYSLPQAWRGRAKGAVWLILAALSAGMATQAYFDPRPPVKVTASNIPQDGIAVTPGLQKEIAALGAQSQDLARQQQEAQARLAALEEQLSSITGSLPRTPAIAAEQPTIMSTEFGVELARATDIGEVDAVWQAMRQLHGPELAALKPAIGVAGTAENRELVLIAGPLANAQDAARICATLRAGGQVCREVPFVGELIPLGA
jgi:hypothetical protein